MLITDCSMGLSTLHSSCYSRSGESNSIRPNLHAAWSKLVETHSSVSLFMRAVRTLLICCHCSRCYRVASISLERSVTKIALALPVIFRVNSSVLAATSRTLHLGERLSFSIRCLVQSAYQSKTYLLCLMLSSTSDLQFSKIASVTY